VWGTLTNSAHQNMQGAIRAVMTRLMLHKNAFTIGLDTIHNRFQHFTRHTAAACHGRHARCGCIRCP